jgi:hypothetical protein
MWSRTLLTAFTMVALLGTTSSVARADLPDDRSVIFTMHETPTDPLSDIVRDIRMDLTASDSDGDWIGWEITQVTFRFFDEYGEVSATWVEDQPDPDTPDGLWWIEHADPQDPTLTEFLEPPAIEGKAAPQGQNGPKLNYYVEGETYIPPEPPQQPPYSPTAALDYSFQVADDPPKEGDDEVVDADDVVDPD